MLTRYVGPRSIFLRPVCRGGYYNKGEGIQMALDIGAAPCGDFGGYHAEPVDPRSGIAEIASATCCADTRPYLSTGRNVTW